MQAFVPKTRRPTFELQLMISDLNNVPLVTGTSCVKWHLSMSASAEQRGHTEKAAIVDHKVAWHYTKTLSVRLTVDKNGMLQDSDIVFEVLQEYARSARAERIVLGSLRLNLAEYVDGGDDSEDGIIRRYLLQDSRINSTLKIGLRMKQTDGDRTFDTPSLKHALTFGGIAGFMMGDDGEGEDGEAVPSMSYKARESSKLRDVYRQNLAATWATQVGELPPDRCIEDIFAGGDGWGEGGEATAPQESSNQGDDDSDSGNKTPRRHQRHTSTGSHMKGIRKPATGSTGGHGSIDQGIHGNSHSLDHGKRDKGHYFNELAEREDLREWVVASHA